MRHVISSGVVLAALFAVRAAAQDKAPVTPTADPHPSEQGRPGGDIKGYGYGTQPGKSDTAAKQEAGNRRASPAAQDERRDGPATRARGSATGVEAHSVTGRVMRLDRGSVSIRSADRRVHRLAVDAGTRVVREGANVSVRSLQPGEEVQAAYDTRGGRPVATTITFVDRGAREPPAHADQARESERRQEGATPTR